jgi:hypothetical protein
VKIGERRVPINGVFFFLIFHFFYTLRAGFSILWLVFGFFGVSFPIWSASIGLT